MAGMRDKLIHDYARVSLEIVWKTIEEDLPHIRTMVEGIVRKEREKDQG